MPSLKVICPKCYKGQQMVGDIPQSGADHLCIYCKTTFKVRPPSVDGSDDLPAAREAVPKPSDLPVARESIPRPSDLPVARESIPRPTDLPISRAAIPKPSDLPAARESIPRPSDLPVSRDAVPRPSDLPVDRFSVPRPGDLPVDRDRVPRPDDLLRAKPGQGTERAPTKTPPLGLALDLSIPDGSDFSDLGLPPPPKAPSGVPPTAFEPPAAPARIPPRPVGPPQTPPPLPPQAGPKMPHFAPLAPQGPSPGMSHLSPLTPELDEPDLSSLPSPPMAEPPLPASPLPSRRSGGGNEDLGFSLELEGNVPQGGQASPDAIPFPKARMAAEGAAEKVAGTDGVPQLAPPVQRRVNAAKALRSGSQRFKPPTWLYFVAGGLVAGLVAYFVVFPMLRFAPRPDVVLRPFASELAKDELTAYKVAADRLVEAGKDYKNGVAPLQLRAAELLLISVAAHGDDGGKLSLAEQLQSGLPSDPKLATEQSRVRALLALGKGKGREVDGLLAEKASPESQLVQGLGRLSQGKRTAAAEVLRKYVAARGDDMVGHYALGKALADSSPAEARRELVLVRGKNPNHVGAAIALAGLETTPEKRLETAQALAAKKPKPVGKREWAELHYVLGAAALELGKQPEAVAALQKAVAEDPTLLPAHIALGEALLYQGNYDEALRRLKFPGDALYGDPAGKFAMAGALIATANWDQGVELLKNTAKILPDDPRGPYWLGFYATQKKPVDLAEAEQGYRDALKREPKFLPASLALASLLQHSNRAEESLKVLREAEESGAPSAVLQMAWGGALVVANEPVKAEAVYRKILTGEPTSVTAILGVATALAAQDKKAEAKDFLEEALKDHPELPSVRQRLAELNIDLGNVADALTRYQEEIQAGRATVALRLKVARLALSLNKLDLVLSESRKALEEQPRCPEAAFLIGKVYETRGEKSQALSEYRRAVGWESVPEFAFAYGKMLVKVGKEQEAMVFLSKAESLPAARLERGRLYFRKGEVNNANQDFAAAAAGMPGEVEPHLLQAMCWDKLGMKDKAEASWRAALKIDPSEPESHYRLGRQEMDRGKPAAALDHLRKATAKLVEKPSWESDLYFQLGQAELLAGSKSSALAAFKKYLDVAPEDAPARPEAEDQVKRLSRK